MFAEDEAELLVTASTTFDELRDRVEKRVGGLPLEQILGWTEFCGLRIVVEEGVFVPRRRTEFLAQQAILHARSRGNIIVDLCCGAGAVGLAVFAALDDSELLAADIEPSAVRCARRNVGNLGQVFQGDLYDPLPVELQGRVTVLLANAPYVPTEAISMMPQEARLYEPMVALDGGPDGLDVQRRVVAEAPLWLAPDGILLIETSNSQAPQTVAIYEQCGLSAQTVTSDDMDASVVIGMKCMV